LQPSLDIKDVEFCTSPSKDLAASEDDIIDAAEKDSASREVVVA
jgi:hypothetical protein